MGQNIWASGVLTLVIAVAMAFAARAVAGIFGNDSISVADFVVISVLGGVLELGHRPRRHARRRHAGRPA
ncbi:MAG: hypothetical protein R2699_04630 [Acidimicrobiales bacterium]